MQRVDSFTCFVFTTESPWEGRQARSRHPLPRQAGEALVAANLLRRGLNAARLPVDTGVDVVGVATVSPAEVLFVHEAYL